MVHFGVSGLGAIACIPKVPPCGCTEVSPYHIFRAQRSVITGGHNSCNLSGKSGVPGKKMQPVTTQFNYTIYCGDPQVRRVTRGAREVFHLGLFRLKDTNSKNGLAS